MKVREVMTANPAVCTRTNTLADAAGLMWDRDCGILPVVAEGGKVVGAITDRDLCMAAALNNRRLSNMAVEDVISGQVFSCRPDDDIRTALKTMQERKVRRLPVLAADGTLEGMLSMNDVVLNADRTEKKGKELSYADVVETYRAICSHPAEPRKQERRAAAGA